MNDWEKGCKSCLTVSGAVLLAVLVAACAEQANTPPLVVTQEAEPGGLAPQEGGGSPPTSVEGDPSAGAGQVGTTVVIPETGVITPTPGGEAIAVETGVIYPEDPSQAGLAPYPDLPLQTVPGGPLAVTDIVEHRSALDSAEVVVRGVVVATLLGEKACPPDRGMCAQPSVFLADSADPNRDPLYDLRVLVSESEVEADYPLGAMVEMRVLISGANVAVVATKLY